MLRPYRESQGKLISRHSKTGDRVYASGDYVEKYMADKHGGMTHLMEILFGKTLTHPNISQFVNVALQLTPQGDIEAALRSRRGRPLSSFGLGGDRSLTLDEILTIAYNLACGLRALHANNIAHADIKPHNAIWIDIDGVKRAQFIDFGLAVSADMDPDKHIGTQPYYFSSGKPFGSINNHDVFALINTLREIIGNNLLTEADFSEKPEQIVHFITDEEQPRVWLAAVFAEDVHPLEGEMIELLNKRSEGLYDTLTDAADAMLRGKRVMLNKLFKDEKCETKLGLKAGELMDAYQQARKNYSQMQKPQDLHQMQKPQDLHQMQKPQDLQQMQKPQDLQQMQNPQEMPDEKSQKAIQDTPEKHPYYIAGRVAHLLERYPSLRNMAPMAKTIVDKACENEEPQCYFAKAELIKKHARAVMPYIQEWKVHDAAEVRQAAHDLERYLEGDKLPWVALSLRDNSNLTAATKEMINVIAQHLGRELGLYDLHMSEE